jgi:hypothetical protein
MKLAVLCLLGAACAGTAGASDVWKSSPPDAWQTRDIEKFLIKSPWSRSVVLSLNASRAAASGGPRGGAGIGGGAAMGGGASGGSAMGGTGESGLGDDAPQLMRPPTAIVRWDSAPIVQAALKDIESKAYLEAVAQDARQYYVVSVTIPRPGGVLHGSSCSGGPPQPWSGLEEETVPGPGPAPDALQARQRMKEFQADMLEHTTLHRGNQRLRPERMRVVESNTGFTMIYLFPRALRLEETAGDLLFDTRIGPLEARTKFHIKDMAGGSIAGY